MICTRVSRALLVRNLQQPNQQEGVILECHAQDFECLPDVVVHALGGKVEFAGDLGMSLVAESAHFEDPSGLFGKCGEGGGVDLHHLAAQIEVGGGELLFVPLLKSFVDAGMEVAALGGVERLVLYDHEDQSLEREILHQQLALLPNVEHRVLHDVLRRGEWYPM